MQALDSFDLQLGKLPLATVLLQHDLPREPGGPTGPGGLHHVDWMIARDSASTLRLVTFRVQQRVDALQQDEELVAERIADHRPLYLDYEGPISGPTADSEPRGCVKRLVRGQILNWRSDTVQKILELQIVWDGPEGPVTQQIQLKMQNLTQWLVICVTIRRCCEAQ